MNWRALFGGKYISAEELDRDTTIRIRDVVREIIPDPETNEERQRGVVFFHGSERGWVLCKTSAQQIAAMLGSDVSTWVGHRVTIYAADVQVGRERKPGIRVRGSPELTAPVTCEIKLPRKKPMTCTLVPTIKGAQTVEDPEPAREPGEEG